MPSSPLNANMPCLTPSPQPSKAGSVRIPTFPMVLELNLDMCALYLRIWLLGVTARSSQGHHRCAPASIGIRDPAFFFFFLVF